MTTTIEWTEVTWNPTVGCDRISPGCAHCYAKELHDRRHKAFLAGKDVAPQYAQPFEVLQLLANRLDAPLRRKNPTTYFVNSVSDLFHDDVPDEYIDRVFAAMALTPRHTYQVLTKRAERMLAYFRSFDGPTAFDRAFNLCAWASGLCEGLTPREVAGPIEQIQCGLPNVWLGVSVENQHFANARIPLLLQTPAAVRFISAEPLLDYVNLRYLNPGGIDALSPVAWPALDWVIVGGESGAGARPFDIAWARSIVAQCKAAGVACFVKQLGARPIFPDGGGWEFPPTNRKGGDPADWPEDLRVREFPAVTAP